MVLSWKQQQRAEKQEFVNHRARQSVEGQKGTIEKGLREVDFEPMKKTEVLNTDHTGKVTVKHLHVNRAGRRKLAKTGQI